MECIVRQIAKKKKKITPSYLDMMISNMKVTWKFQIVKFIFWVCSFSLSFFLVFHVFYLGSFASLLSLLFFFLSLSPSHAWPFSSFYKARECHTFAQQYEADSQDHYDRNGDASWGAGRLFFFLVWFAEKDEQCLLK
jgi:hypothetical protein